MVKEDERGIAGFDPLLPDANGSYREIKIQDRSAQAVINHRR